MVRSLSSPCLSKPSARGSPFPWKGESGSSHLLRGQFMWINTYESGSCLSPALSLCYHLFFPGVPICTSALKSPYHKNWSLSCDSPVSSYMKALRTHTCLSQWSGLISAGFENLSVRTKHGGSILEQHGLKYEPWRHGLSWHKDPLSMQTHVWLHTSSHIHIFPTPDKYFSLFVWKKSVLGKKRNNKKPKTHTQKAQIFSI